MPAKLLVPFALLAGCAPYSLPPLAPDHPASLEAAETPRPAPSAALAGEALPPPSPSAGKRDARGSGHGEHR
ncbi:MAG: hypothetical protein ACREQY_20100 [Candidatus Binatia bacterium]